MLYTDSLVNELFRQCGALDNSGQAKLNKKLFKQYSKQELEYIADNLIHYITEDPERIRKLDLNKAWLLFIFPVILEKELEKRIQKSDCIDLSLDFSDQLKLLKKWTRESSEHYYELGSYIENKAKLFERRSLIGEAGRYYNNVFLKPNLESEIYKFTKAILGQRSSLEESIPKKYRFYTTNNFKILNKELESLTTDSSNGYIVSDESMQQLDKNIINLSKSIKLHKPWRMRAETFDVLHFEATLFEKGTVILNTALVPNEPKKAIGVQKKPNQEKLEVPPNITILPVAAEPLKIKKSLVITLSDTESKPDELDDQQIDASEKPAFNIPILSPSTSIEEVLANLTRCNDDPGKILFFEMQTRIEDLDALVSKVKELCEFHGIALFAGNIINNSDITPELKKTMAPFDSDVIEQFKAFSEKFPSTATLAFVRFETPDAGDTPSRQHYYFIWRPVDSKKYIIFESTAQPDLFLREARRILGEKNCDYQHERIQISEEKNCADLTVAAANLAIYNPGYNAAQIASDLISPPKILNEASFVESNNSHLKDEDSEDNLVFVATAEPGFEQPINYQLDEVPIKGRHTKQETYSITNPFFLITTGGINLTRYRSEFFNTLETISEIERVLYYLQFLMSINTDNINVVKDFFAKFESKLQKLFIKNSPLLSIQFLENLASKSVEQVCKQILDTFISEHETFEEFLSVVLTNKMIDKISDELFDMFLRIWIEKAVAKKIDPIKIVESINLNLDYKRAVQFTRLLPEQQKAILQQEEKANKGKLEDNTVLKGDFDLYSFVDDANPNNKHNIEQLTRDVNVNPNSLLKINDKNKNVNIDAPTQVYIFSKRKTERSYEWYETNSYNEQGEIIDTCMNKNSSLYKVENNIQELTESQTQIQARIVTIDQEIQRLDRLLEDFFVYNRELAEKKLEVLKNLKLLAENAKLTEAISKHPVDLDAYIDKDKTTGCLKEHRHPEWIRTMMFFGKEAAPPDSARVLEPLIKPRNIQI